MQNNKTLIKSKIQIKIKIKINRYKSIKIDYWFDH